MFFKQISNCAHSRYSKFPHLHGLTVKTKCLYRGFFLGLSIFTSALAVVALIHLLVDQIFAV